MSDVKPIIYQLMPPAEEMATPTNNNDKTGIAETHDNPAPTTQESTPRRRYPVNPHLQDHRDAKAAASDLRCTQQFLEEYRLSCVGRCCPDKRIQFQIMPSFHKACGKFREIVHPGIRAARAFFAALQATQVTLALLFDEHERVCRARMRFLADRQGFLMISIPDRSRRGPVVAPRVLDSETEEPKSKD
jgi:hypothetical protein